MNFKVNSILLCLLLIGQACKRIPPLEADIKIGDSQTQSLIAAEEINDVACQAEEFNNYICMHRDDFVEEFMLRFKCERWESGTTLIDPRDIDIPEFLEDEVDAEIEKNR